MEELATIKNCHTEYDVMFILPPQPIGRSMIRSEALCPAPPPYCR